MGTPSRKFGNASQPGLTGLRRPASFGGWQSRTPTRDREPRPAPQGGNVSGRARALTLLTPVRPAWMPFLRFVHVDARATTRLQDAQPAVQLHLLRALGDRSRSSPAASSKRYTYLLFESNFDVPWRQYIDAFAYVIPNDISVIWGRGFAFPGPPPAEPLKRWIAMQQPRGRPLLLGLPAGQREDGAGGARGARALRRAGHAAPTA